jgi:hypothetical protein
MVTEGKLTTEQIKTNIQAHEAATTPYHTALGLFISQFAMLENIMNILLVNISGIDQKAGPAVFSGTRVSGAKSFINRLLNTQNMTDNLKCRLKHYFDRIGVINGARDEILHYGGFYRHDTNQILVSNARSAHIEKNLRECEVNAQILLDLTTDTISCYRGVLVELCRYSSTPESIADLQSGIVSPWRYKEPQLIPPATESQKGDQ